MFCNKCGSCLEDGVKYCKNCGNVLEEQNNEDKGGFKWGLLGCLFFEAGLAVYFIWRNKNPNNASAIKKGMIVGIILKVIFSIFYAISVAGSLNSAYPL